MKPSANIKDFYSKTRNKARMHNFNFYKIKYLKVLARKVS